MRNCKFYRECHQKAVTEIPYSKMPVCKEHFIKYIQDRVWKTIQEFNLIEFNPEEKLLVAISGGKDSQTLLTILNSVINKRIQVEALYIDVGITPRNYGKDSGEIARELCADLDIPFHVINVKDVIGFDIDDVHALGKRYPGNRRKNDHFRGECSYCGLIKRYYINYFAVTNNFTKVATGHNLTDEATALFANFFSSDIELMSRAGPTTITEAEGLVTRIKPLYYIYEEELILYSLFANVKHLSTQCAYATDSPMINLKKSLLKVEKIRRGNMMHFVRKFQKKLKPILFEAIPSYKMADNKCVECGMGTYLDRCSFCKTKDRLRNQINKMYSKTHVEEQNDPKA